MFLKIFVYGVIYLLIWLFQFYIFYLFGIGFNPEITAQLIIWKNVYYGIYFYYGILEIVMIIIFGYVINHFVKSVTLIYELSLSQQFIYLFLADFFIQL